MAKPKTCVNEECEQGDHPEDAVKDPPVSKVSEAEPLKSFTEGKKKADEKDCHEGKSCNLLNHGIAPKLIDLIPPGFH